VGDDLGDGPLRGVGQQVEPGGGSQDPESVDAGGELVLDQLRQRQLVDRAVGLERGGQGRDDSVQPGKVHRKRSL
jgi:hypothetical protein